MASMSPKVWRSSLFPFPLNCEILLSTYSALSFNDIATLLFPGIHFSSVIA